MSDLAPPTHPYRSAAILHGALAFVIVVLAGITGGDLVKAVLVAAAYFVLATSWSWMRLRQRATRRSRAQPHPSNGDRSP